MADNESASKAPKASALYTAAADYKSFTTFEVEFWSAWEALKNSFLNVLRYVIIAGLFVYLLTAVILLSDIMAFHDRVKSDVGDDARARRAVLMLHKMHENPDKYPKGDAELPVGTLAVSLGSLKSTYADLTQFSRFTVTKSEGEPGSGTTASQSSGSKRFTAEDLKTYENLQREMLARAEKFGDRLRNNDPLVHIKEAIDQFKINRKTSESAQQEISLRPDLRLANLEEDFAELRVALITAYGDVPAHDLLKRIQDRLSRLTYAVSAPDEVDALKSDVQSLDTRMDAVLTAIDSVKTHRAALNGASMMNGATAAIDGVINEAEDKPLPSEYLQNIQTRVSKVHKEPISLVEYSAELDWLKLDIQGLRRALMAFPNSESQRDTLTGSVTLLELANAEPVSQESIATYAKDWEDLQRDISDIDENLPINAVVPELRKALHAMDRDLSAARDHFETPSPAEERELPSFDRYLTHIEQALGRRFGDEFAIASSLVDDLGHLRSQLTVLAAIQPAEYRDPNSDLIRGQDAQDIFEARLEAMKEGLVKAEAKLEKQGRVVALANVLEEDENETAEGAKIKAAGILQDYDALNRFGWLMMPLTTLGLVSPRSPWAEFGLNPLRLATLTTPSITTIYVLVIGAIGSLIYITKYQLKLVVDGHMLRTRPPRPLPWFLFRPIFGVVVALALYFLIRAGQLALGSGTDEEVGTTLNIPVLSVLALFAGILSWQALAMIETRGGIWFKEQSREPLWATGLSNALRTREKSIAECAQQIGRTQEQVGRWLSFKDKVPIEMQDRISTWIDMRLDELFGEFKPTARVAGEPMWAVGLKHALDSYDKQIDAEALVELLREDHRPENIDRIRAWIALKQQVPPATQWRLVDLLDVPHHLLFAPEKQNRSVWGTKLRRAIESRNESVRTVATRMGVQPEQVHAWKELDERVSPVMQKRLMDVLERTFTQLFEAGDLDDHEGLLKVPLNMSGALKGRNIVPKVFARRIDVEPKRVDNWCHDNVDKRGKIAQPTCDRIERVLDEYGPGPDPFEKPAAALPDEQDEADQAEPRPTPQPAGGAGRRKAAHAISLAKIMKMRDNMNVRTLARLVYEDKLDWNRIHRVQGWIDGKNVSPAMQDRLVEVLKTTHADLFG